MTDMNPNFDRHGLASLDPRNPAPLYHQLYHLIKSKIEHGTLKFGEALPSELMLVERFGISRITAKRALDELAREGLVDRARGRGTHVRYRYEPNFLRAPLTGMLESLVIMGRETTVDVLALERVLVPVHLRAPMHLRDEDFVERATRVRRNQGEPFAHYISHTHLPKGGAKLFTAKALRSQCCEP
jgi:GntR family transcriptional regulator